MKSYQPSAKWPAFPTYQSMHQAARAAFPTLPIGGGMYSYFTELNRCRPPVDLFDFVSHTTLPIVHAADDVSVMETLESLPHIIRSTRAFMKGAPYRIGPSSLAARDNPYGAETAENPNNSRVCLASMDPRQRGLFGAAWTLGYLAAMANGGIDVASVSAPTGALGIISRKTYFPQPYYDDIGGRAFYPVYHVVAGLALGAGKRLHTTKVSRPGAIAAIAWHGDSGSEIWLANLTANIQVVMIPGNDGQQVFLSILDEDNFVDASRQAHFIETAKRSVNASEPLTLKAYAIAKVAIADE
jgi:hypothetical protein